MYEPRVQRTERKSNLTPGRAATLLVSNRKEIISAFDLKIEPAGAIVIPGSLDLGVHGWL
jgi:hypothetical protein